MNSRQRVLAVLNNEPVDRLPVDLWYTREWGQTVKKHLNVSSESELYRCLQLDKIVMVFPAYNDDPSRRGTETSKEIEQPTRNIWGVPLRKVRAGAADYQEYGTPPLAGCNSPDQLEDYPFWPNAECFDYSGAGAIARQASQDFATMGPWISFFEIYCQLRGMEQALMDLVENPELADAILDRIENIQTKMLRNYLDSAGAYLDLVFVSDDMGTQQGLMINPDLWERFFATRLARWCHLIHRYGKKVFYHSDGAIEPLIDGLIDCGIDVLNPIQHICAGMDMENLKSRYGRKLIFHGGVDNQSVLPFGSPPDVRNETRRCMAALGADGKGYIVCSCHNVQAGTPVENILEMIKTGVQDGDAL